MDRIIAIYACKHCGQNRSLSTYDASACTNVNGCQESNASDERKLLRAKCGACGKQGFKFLTLRTPD